MASSDWKRTETTQKMEIPQPRGVRTPVGFTLSHVCHLATSGSQSSAVSEPWAQRVLLGQLDLGSWLLCFLCSQCLAAPEVL